VSDDSTLAAMANTTPACDAPADVELPGGTIVADRWTIVRFLARGGMGEVYEAHDRLLDGPVALKTLRRGMAHDRFVREIQLARKVSHPNVCRIHDAGRHGDLSFLTMELLAGESLAERLRRGPLPIAEARVILADLAAALDAAHAAGVIHRDFKPHNVMLVRRAGATRAVVTDFGIARPADDTGDAALTADGELVGTPAYMAPEQVSGKPITAVSDVYSFGVVAYELVTGTLPFAGQNPRELATARLTETPRPPRDLVKDLDPRWDAAIVAALAVDPAARPASASAVLALTDAPPPPTPVSTDRARVVLLSAAAAGVLLAALVLGLLLTGRLGWPTPVAHIDAATTAETQRTPPLTYNMAQAYRRKGDLHQALHHFRRFVVLASDPDSAAIRADAQHYIWQLEAALAADGGVAP